MKIFCSDKTWLESNAVDQFNRIMKLDGMIDGYGFPDLHPGRGIPIGAAFLSRKLIYPALIGNDIGCGMTLFALDAPMRKLKTDKFLRKLNDNCEDIIKQTTLACLMEMNEIPDYRPDIFNVSDPLGTIGHGNHFIEIQSIEKVFNEEAFKSLNLQKDSALILIHCGSRGYGESLWNAIASRHGDKGVPFDSPDGQRYLEIHNQLINWACFNRRLIGKAIGKLFSSDVRMICDSVHNSIKPYGNGLFIHRKGASEVNGSPVVVAGSRGTFSYLVKPNNNLECLHSISHGCGRKWDRQSSKARIKEKHPNLDSLLQSDLGTKIICDNKDLLYEEAPEAYKNINDVVHDLQTFHLASPILSLKPILNIKP